MAQQGQMDLLSIFKQVSKSVKQNKDTLNQADSYNHDHGDHMVEIFDVITQAMKEKKNADPADQLEYAAQILRRKSNSGSGKVYADNLESAAKQVTGKDINIGMILTILQSLMGASQKSGGSGNNDMLTTLLGSLLGGGSSSSGAGDHLGSLLGQKGGSSMSTGGSGAKGADDLLGSLLNQVGGSSPQSGGSGADDLLGSLMGQMAGSSSRTTGSNQGLDLNDLLGAGLKALANSQDGKSGLDSLAGTLLSGSQMAESDHRKQSGEIVTKAVLGALTSMMQK
jgi:hypothetical protein